MAYDIPSGGILTDDPAAGSEISYTTLYDYKVNMIKITFVTDGVAGNRDLIIRFTVKGNVIYEVPLSASITANVTEQILLGTGFPYQSSGDYHFLPLPIEFKIPRGTIIETVTTGMDTGDNYEPAVLFVEKL